MNPPTPGEGFVCENCNLGYRPTQTRSDDKWLERICCASIAHRISTHDSSLRMWSRANSFEPRRNLLERGEIDTAPRRMRHARWPKRLARAVARSVRFEDGHSTIAGAGKDGRWLLAILRAASQARCGKVVRAEFAYNHSVQKPLAREEKPQPVKSQNHVVVLCGTLSANAALSDDLTACRLSLIRRFNRL
jgi:hypothetical protein